MPATRHGAVAVTGRAAAIVGLQGTGIHPDERALAARIDIAKVDLPIVLDHHKARRDGAEDALRRVVDTLDGGDFLKDGACLASLKHEVRSLCVEGLQTVHLGIGINACNRLRPLHACGLVCRVVGHARQRGERALVHGRVGGIEVGIRGHH